VKERKSYSLKLTWEKSVGVSPRFLTIPRFLELAICLLTIWHDLRESMERPPYFQKAFPLPSGLVSLPF
jgi:hypothetical protein